MDCGLGAFPVEATLTPCRPWAMLAAPNRIKHPTSTVAARRMFIRPDNISKPMEATAMTAMLVATGPNRSSCTHWIPVRKTLGAADPVARADVMVAHTA